MQLVRRILPIIFIMLYSILNISIYNHMHTNEHEQCASTHHHAMNTDDNSDSCALCFFMYVPQIAESLSIVDFPEPILFEIVSDYSTRDINIIQSFVYVGTNKDPPSA